MIEAVIFDMDGLLIDSEPLWQEAQFDAFKKVGIKLNKELCLQTMGWRVDKVVEHWHNKYPWENYTKKEIEDGISKNVVSLIRKKAYLVQVLNMSLIM